MYQRRAAQDPEPRNEPGPGRDGGTVLPTEEVIREWLVSRLSAEVGVAVGEIDIRDPFDRYGLSSAQALSLAGQLEQWLGQRVSPTLAWEYPTIDAPPPHLSGQPETP